MAKTFEEVQRFDHWLLWLLLAGMGLLMSWICYEQLTLGQAVGSKPMPDAVLIGVTLFCWLMILFFWVARLRLRVDGKGVHFKYSPFVADKFFAWDAIKTAAVIDYGFVGGWGVRYTRRYGTVYNMRGRQGLAIELDSGKKIVIGTQEPEALSSVLAMHTKAD